MLATTSLATSRIMLSIHSLAAKLGSENGWLFNHIELSRIGYKNGAREGELIIERLTVEDEREEIEKASTLSLKTTRVGMLHE
jgi:hypothetical protein